MVARTAEASWEGDLPSGKGVVSGRNSGKLENLAVTWASRTEDPAGRTSPEELLAAAHASCFSMALSNELAKAGTTAERLDVSAKVTADRVDGKLTVLSSELTVRGRVPGATAAGFQAAAEGAKDGCPISRALMGNVKLSVAATLES
jgi:osmotically inducible protein OsmC